jgi:hypothetical protein
MSDRSDRLAHTPCSVVWDNACTAPANGDASTRAACFACGEPACTACSTVVTWYGYGRRRIGFDCLEQHGRLASVSAALAVRDAWTRPALHTAARGQGLAVYVLAIALIIVVPVVCLALFGAQAADILKAIGTGR